MDIKATTQTSEQFHMHRMMNCVEKSLDSKRKDSDPLQAFWMVDTWHDRSDSQIGALWMTEDGYVYITATKLTKENLPTPVEVRGYLKVYVNEY